MRQLIKALLSATEEVDTVEVNGWVRTRRDAKGFSFIELNDGSSLKGIQVIVADDVTGYAEVKLMTTGASVKVMGKLVASPGKGQKWEIQASEIRLVGASPEDFPLQKKGHSQEFLRSIAHLRPRTNLYGAVFRVRSYVAQAVHRFFAERDFHWIHTPIITASDCEGAGEMFRVTTHDPSEAKASSFADDFFERAAYLTVSGQLEGEVFATALSNIYTFGPTFRAENSNTTRHAAEFWMVEPEMAFCDLQGDMELAEEFIQWLTRDALAGLVDDLEIFDRFVEKGLLPRLAKIADGGFSRIRYADAVELLRASGQKFDYPVEYGVNLQAEHERWLTEQYFKCPLTVFDYPKDVKPFYMRVNDDGMTVAAMDLLVPGIGELIGGSQREERLEQLTANLSAHGLSLEHYSWYLDLRKYGTVPHAGFGMGFERFLMFLTGIKNIRDVIPFARTPGQCEF